MSKLKVYSFISILYTFTPTSLILRGQTLPLTDIYSFSAYKHRGDLGGEDRLTHFTDIYASSANLGGDKPLKPVDSVTHLPPGLEHTKVLRLTLYY